MRTASGFLSRGFRGILAALLLATGQSPGRADPPVLLQGFWWNFWNNNHPGSWADYLAHLAPRLRDLGIEAIWIPPTVKNQNALNSVGYAPFDHYDLGDKWQGGSTRTRFGTKDEYLRAVAVLQANGIAVIQDVVLNHLSGAGAGNGAGGSDPTAPGDSFKNFRYACWATPAHAATAADYLARRGRFPKNAPNFHPNPDHDSTTGNITAQLFGPDICYYRLARGPSGNATFNPVQGLDPMRNGARAWMIWLKKQTGVDGFRLDAVKHFETWAAKDFVWNAAYNAGFASGGPGMFCVGEYVGGAAELDAWVDQVNHSDGFTDVVGTFDFGLRGALKAMIDAPGTYDLGSLPAAQQQRRSRTVPFLNSHDTFRPILDSSGRYTGWNTADELGGHIDPAHPRLPAAYAVACALDGSPCVFFEDLFDLHSTGRRFTHRPADPVTLPVRDYLRNLLGCHRHLRFKEVAGRVRWQAPDLLAIERSGRAVILASDRPAQWQSVTVQTDFPAGTRLRDHGGS
ncbi:MAG: alpha-amylase family glycosyl hydrolase, partial [Verrucomicrobiota bacterium]